MAFLNFVIVDQSFSKKSGQSDLALSTYNLPVTVTNGAFVANILNVRKGLTPTVEPFWNYTIGGNELTGWTLLIGPIPPASPTTVRVRAGGQAQGFPLFGNGVVVLGNVSLSGVIANGTISSGTIVGATNGSTLVSNVTGLTINSLARTYTFDGSAFAGTVSNGIVETLSGAVGSPKSNPIAVADFSAIQTPVLSNLSSGWVTGQNPPIFDLAYSGYFYDPVTGTGDQLRWIWRLGGTGPFTTAAWVPVDTTLIANNVFPYAFLTDGTLAGGGLFEVSVQAGRDIGLGTQVLSSNSNLWTDALSAPGLTATTVSIGDSWYGNANPPYSGFYLGSYYQTHSEHSILNLGKGGTGLDWIATKRAEVATAKPYIIVLSFGRNDFMSGAYSSGSVDPAVNYPAYVAYYLARINELKADNPGVAIVVETITEQHSSPDSAYLTTYNAYRKTLNAQIRQWKADGVIAEYIDIGAEATIGADGHMLPGSPETADGTHLTETPNGNGKALIVFENTMNAFYAAHPAPEDSVSDFAIQPFSPPAKNEGNSGTTVYSTNVTRTGALTHAASVQWAVTGTGTNPANATDFVGGVFPSGTLTFNSGDIVVPLVVNVQGDATVEADETFTVTLSNPVTVGTISLATTVGTITNDDVGGGSLTTTYRSSAAHNDGFGAASNFTGLTTYTGLKHIVCIESSNGGASPTAVSLDGTSMTKRAEVITGNNAISFWDCTITTGGTGKTLAITQASAYAIAYGMWTTDSTATYVASANKASSTVNDPQETSASLTLPSGGSALIGALGFGPGPITANSGTAQDAQLVEATSSDICWFGHLTATGKPSLNGLVFAGSQILAVSYQP